MAKSIEERLKKLEVATGTHAPALIYIGQAPDGSPQYLDVMTGEFLPELPSYYVIVGQAHVDLKEI